MKWKLRTEELDEAFDRAREEFGGAFEGFEGAFDSLIETADQLSPDLAAAIGAVRTSAEARLEAVRAETLAQLKALQDSLKE
jgi:hypothetical protein